MRNCPARIATEQVAAEKIKQAADCRKMSFQSLVVLQGKAESNSYRRPSARRLLKVARKARIPLYLSFAQRKIIYRLLSANNPE